MVKRLVLGTLYLVVGGAFAASLTVTGLLLGVASLLIGGLLVGGVGPFGCRPAAPPADAGTVGQR